MKRYLVFLLIVCLTLVGCDAKDNAVKGQIDRTGFINEVDVTGNRMLVDDPDNGLIWLTLPKHEDITKYRVNQEVVAWIGDGIKESSPAQAVALNIEILKVEQLPPDAFDFSEHAFPPNLTGFVEINGTRYKMAKGGFKWTRKNQSVMTDAAGPTQLAEKFKPIIVEANSEATIVIEQNPSLSAYIVHAWDAEQQAVTVEDGDIILPATPGTTIYEVVAQWTNGSVSFTFVVDVK